MISGVEVYYCITKSFIASCDCANPLLPPLQRSAVLYRRKNPFGGDKGKAKREKRRLFDLHCSIPRAEKGGTRGGRRRS